MMRLVQRSQSVVPRFRRAYAVRATISEPLPADSPLRQGRLKVGFSTKEGTDQYNARIQGSLLFGASQPQLWAAHKADLLKSGTPEDKSFIDLVERSVHFQKYAFTKIPSPADFEKDIRAQDEIAIAQYNAKDAELAEALRTAF